MQNMSHSQFNQPNTSQSLSTADNQNYNNPNQNFFTNNQNIVYTNNPQNSMINNQYINQQLYSDDHNLKALKSTPSYVFCPNCKNVAATKIEEKCNIPNICCGICFGMVIWLVYQITRGKDINCYDAVHTCGRCGVKLNQYSAC